MTDFMAAGTTFILPSDLQPLTYFRAIEKYKVCQTAIGKFDKVESIS